MVEIKEREGMVVEGDDGVPLLILLTSVQWQSMKVTNYSSSIFQHLLVMSQH